MNDEQTTSGTGEEPTQATPAPAESAHPEGQQAEPGQAAESGTTEQPETAHWHPHEYPTATPTQPVPVSDHGTGAGIPQHDPTGGLSQGVTGQPAGAQTGHAAVDTGGASSGAGAGSDADVAETQFKVDQAEAISTGQVRGVAGEAEVAAARGDDTAQQALDDRSQARQAADERAAGDQETTTSEPSGEGESGSGSESEVTTTTTTETSTRQQPRRGGPAKK